MSIIIKEVIRNCGNDWYSNDIMERQEWLNKNLSKDTYRVWYGGTVSDERYTRFQNEEDALAYTIRWITS